MKFPKGLRTPEDRSNIAQEICRMIDAAIEQQGDISDRWELNESFYRSQPIPTGTEVSGVTRPINITKPRIDQIVANVCGPTFSVEPYFSARGYGSKGQHAKNCEKNVHFVNQRAQLDRRVKKAVKRAALTAPAIMKVTFQNGDGEESDTGKYVGPDYKVIHPKNFAMYPLYTGTVEKAGFVGDRMAMRAQDIREEQKRGTYFTLTEVIEGGDEPQGWEAGRSKDWSLTNEDSGILDRENEAVEVWEGILRKDLDQDGFEELYLVHVAKTQQLLLMAEPFGVEVEMVTPQFEDDGTGNVVQVGEESQSEFRPYSRPWYFPINLTEADDDEFIQSNTVAQDLQGPQMMVNEIVNVLLEGAMIGAMPAGFTNSSSMPNSLIRYKWGEIHYVEDPLNIVWVQPKFDPSVMPEMLEFALKVADSLTKMSQAGLGQESQGDTTATEYSGILQGQQVGVDDTRSTVATCLAPMMDFVREMMFLNWETLLEYYEDEMPYPDIECMQYGFTWEPMVKGSANTPQSVTMQIQAFMGFLGQLGIPLTPEVVVQLLNVFMGSLDLPVDHEELKTAVLGAFQVGQEQQMMMAQQEQEMMADADDEMGRERGIRDGFEEELSNQLGGGSNGRVPGLQAVAGGVPGEAPDDSGRPPWIR